MFLLLLITFFLNSPLKACDSDFAFESFKKLDEIVGPVSLYAAILKIKDVSTNPEETIEDNSGRCTASVVSSNGHIVSAMHCFKDCLIESGALEKKSDIYNDDGKNVKISYFSRSRNKTIWRTCKANIDGYGIVNLKVSALGDCDQESFVDSLSRIKLQKENKNNLIAEKCSHENDFVILQSNDLKLKDHKCLQNSNMPPLNEKVLSAGFPMQTWRLSNNNSNGESLYTSPGKTVSQNYCYKKTHKILNTTKAASKDVNDSNSVSDAQVPAEIIKYDMNQQLDFSDNQYDYQKIEFGDDWKAKLKGSRLIQSTSDGVPGNSGGPLINTKGRIIGVASFLYNTDPKMPFGNALPAGNLSAQCAGSVYYLPIDVIKEKISQQKIYDNDLSDTDYFDCKNSSN